MALSEGGQGRTFFQEWGLALHGQPELAPRIRQSLALTISMHMDLSTEAQAYMLACYGTGTCKDYLAMVEYDLGFTGGKIEIVAAARFDNVKVHVFDVEEQKVFAFAPHTPTTREVFMMHWQGSYWLLEPVFAASSSGPFSMLNMSAYAGMGAGGEMMEMGMTGELDDPMNCSTTTTEV